MIEPPVVPDRAGGAGTLRPLKKSVQRRHDSRNALGPRDPAMVNTDSDSRESKTHRGDTASRAARAPIRDQAIGRIGQVPKVVEVTRLDVIEEFIIAGEGMRHY